MSADLPPATLAFRVAGLAGAVGLIGWAPPILQTMGGGALLLVAAAFGFEAVARSRKGSRARREHLLWCVLCLIGAGVLLSGFVGSMATPLMALAGVAGALGLVALLSETEPTPEP